MNNFQDFYAQLLEQYQGVSYGNILFANVILIPLAQRHNVKWRKTLWSEYAGAVQILNMTPEQVLHYMYINLNFLNSYFVVCLSFRRISVPTRRRFIFIKMLQKSTGEWFSAQTINFISNC